MRTTLVLNDELMAKARALTGLKEKSSSGPRGAKGSDRAGKRAAAGAPGRQRTRPREAAKAPASRVDAEGSAPR